MRAEEEEQWEEGEGLVELQEKYVVENCKKL